MTTSSDLERVIVTPCPTVGTQVHHRDFPEIRARGGDTRDAAGQLLNQLTRALDSALTDWRRDAIQIAIAEVKAYAESQPPALAQPAR